MSRKYAVRIPQTLTATQQNSLLEVTSRQGRRDFVLYTLALDTGLREHECVALNCGDVYIGDGAVRPTIQLRTYKRSNYDETQQVVVLATPEVRKALAAFRTWKVRQGQSVAAEAPLFMSAKGGARLSTRGVRDRFAHWLAVAGIPAAEREQLSFHALRHTACTQVQRQHKDPRLTQAFARHASLESTQIYMHCSIDDVAAVLATVRPSAVRK